MRISSDGICGLFMLGQTRTGRYAPEDTDEETQTHTVLFSHTGNVAGVVLTADVVGKSKADARDLHAV